MNFTFLVILSLLTWVFVIYYLLYIKEYKMKMLMMMMITKVSIVIQIKLKMLKNLFNADVKETRQNEILKVNC